MNPRYTGRLASERHAARMVRAPLMSLESLMSATARPTINILKKLATPQSKKPSSKITRKVRKVNCDR
jgi:hypothetical protein